MCSISGCERKKRSRGMCAVHYNKNLREGNFSKSEKHNHGEVCSFDSCNGKYLCKGFCERHYKIFKKHGYIKLTYKDIPVIERFKARCIKKASGCIEWNGFVNHEGYGAITVDARVIRAHRFSYAYYKGAIPDGMLVCHKCDNPRCVNADHLFLGTNQDNVNDKVKKNRQSRLKGEDSGTSKLTEKDVIKIKIMLENGDSYKVIADRFNVTKTPIYLINKKKSWKHVSIKRG